MKNNKKTTQPKSTRDAYGEALLLLGEQNKSVVALSANLAESTRLHLFGQKYPDRFIEVGVAEQNMLGVATGLALEGKIPFVSSFGAFSPGRNWDQLRVSVCYSNANVKIVSTHTGLAVGPDGASHQALEDIAITRCIPNITVIAPADYTETKKAVAAIAEHKGPVYMRLTRQKSPLFTDSKKPFEIGKADILLEGDDVTVAGHGPVLHEALKAAKILKDKNIELEVINFHTVKPIDKETLIKSVQKTDRLLTIEDHQVAGGLGSALVEVLAEERPTLSKMMGVEDAFGESSSQEKLWEKHKLTAKHIARAAERLTNTY